jgi:hypothetical protein
MAYTDYTGLTKFCQAVKTYVDNCLYAIVTIDGYTLRLDKSKTYSEQETPYNTLYTADVCQPGVDPSTLEIDCSTTKPRTGDILFTSCRVLLTVTIDGNSVYLFGDASYATQGYDELYDTNICYYPETPDMHGIDEMATFPEQGDIFFTTCVQKVIVEIDETQVELESQTSYESQGYDTLYTQNSYSTGSVEDYLISEGTLPQQGDILWTYCHYSPALVTVTIDGSEIQVHRDETYKEQGYSTLYTQNTYTGASPDEYLIPDSTTPTSGDILWTYCNHEEPVGERVVLLNINEPSSYTASTEDGTGTIDVLDSLGNQFTFGISGATSFAATGWTGETTWTLDDTEYTYTPASGISMQKGALSAKCITMETGVEECEIHVALGATSSGRKPTLNVDGKAQTPSSGTPSSKQYYEFTFTKPASTSTTAYLYLNNTGFIPMIKIKY